MTAADTTMLTHCQRWILESLCIAHIWDGGITVESLASLLSHSPHYTGEYLAQLKELKLAAVTRRSSGDVWKPLARGYELAEQYPKVVAAMADKAAILAEAS
ncbi:hypothetical protein [Nocardia sp. NPDC051833]|uniref:hypothetical protein n=1 Tax=Nocardia sp. NPDC051833 TaxID=3155674 RepID=UPI00343779A4